MKPTEDTPTTKKDSEEPSLSLHSIPAKADGSSIQADQQLREAVKRFCRTEEAADTLVAYIRAQQIQLVSELEGKLAKNLDVPATTGDVLRDEMITLAVNTNNRVLDQIRAALEHKKQELERGK